MKMLKSQLITLPTPSSINMWWNFGMLLGFVMIIQLITGVFLSFHYLNDHNLAFYSINHMLRDTNNGWMMKTFHSNGASMFFILMYLHLFRGLFFSSFLKKTWLVGVTILLLSMLTAFLGYVLPWGQMSYWGTTVITNLLSSVPYIGQTMVVWLWGGPSVSGPTLNRFFSLHFLMPFILLLFILIHLLLLHEKGSSNPTNLLNKKDMFSFHILFTYKDLLFTITLMLIFTSFLLFPHTFNDPENFNMASNVKTPTHIQPEWYFLFAYTILRSVPNKFGGVCALLMSILILYIIPFIWQKKTSTPKKSLNKIIILFLFLTLFMLTWIGMKPVMYPFDMMGKFFSILYFILILSITTKYK